MDNLESLLEDAPLGGRYGFIAVLTFLFAIVSFGEASVIYYQFQQIDKIYNKREAHPKFKVGPPVSRWQKYFVVTLIIALFAIVSVGIVILTYDMMLN